MSCSCNDCNDITLFTGAPGADGNNGIFGGHSSKWKFDGSTTAPGPSSTFIRVNNATLSSVTEIYINEANFDSLDVSAFLTSFNATGDYGLIRIFKEFDANTFWIGQITNIVDAGTYRTLTVTHTQSNGTFATDDAIVVTFTPLKEGTFGGDEGSIVATGTWDLTTTTYTAPGSAPGQYANLIYQNTTGESKTYKIDASFNCGDATTDTSNPNGMKLCVKAAVRVGALGAGVTQYEVHNFFTLASDLGRGARQGQAFTIQVTVPNNEYVTLELATSDAAAAPENGRVNSATLYYREV
jgi:hypothetical protein